jgi:glucose/arabinose dehydrogenase
MDSTTTTMIIVLVAIFCSSISGGVGYWLWEEKQKERRATKQPISNQANPAPVSNEENPAPVKSDSFATLPAGAGLATCIIPFEQGLLITSKNGKVYKVKKNKAEEWLDVAPDVNTVSEAGLLDICLHPKFQTNGIFYIKHVNGKNEIVVSKGKGSSTRGGSLETLFKVVHASNGRNHYGGGLHVGPDNMLYFAIGDCEAKERAPDESSPYGKILKMSLEGGPTSVFVKGLRNPWRTHFSGNNLYIADVGTDKNKGKERVFMVPINSKADCGWPETEDPDGGKYLKPIFSWGSQSKGECIIGGITYRGSKTSLKGTYIYGAFRPADIFAYNLTTGNETKVASIQGRVSAIGEDQQGEIYFGTENVIYSL